jgi:predicted nucleic acid-binding protein
MKCYVDSDVVIDLLSKRPGFYEASRDFFKMVEAGHVKAGVASLTFSNAHFVMQRYFEAAEILARLERFKVLVEVLAVDGRQIHRALRSNFSDFEDAIQHECALANKMDCIVTRDLKDFKLSDLPVYSPTDAMKIIVRKR